MAAVPTLRELVLRIVAEAFPALVYGVPRTYVVQSVRSDGRLDLSPPPDAVALPELVNVEPWTLNGVMVAPTPGTEVVVVFRDASPSRPVVVGYAQGVAAAGGSPNATTPTRLEVDASDTIAIGASASAVELAGGGDGVARIGDTAGQLTEVSGKIWYKPGGITSLDPYLPIIAYSQAPPVWPDPTPPTYWPGTPIVIDSGSSTVTSG